MNRVLPFCSLLLLLFIPTCTTDSPIVVEDLGLSLLAFSSCNIKLLFIFKYDFGELGVPVEIRIEPSPQHREPSSKISKAPFCKANFVMYRYSTHQLISQIHFNFVQDRTVLREPLFPKKSICPGPGTHHFFKGSYETSYFILIGPQGTMTAQNELMAELMRLEYPNHWFFFNLISTDHTSSSLEKDTVHYLCLRCIPPYVPGSDYEFIFWNWLPLTIESRPIKLSELKKDYESQIAMLFWWDYFHMSHWRKYGREILSMSPGRVLQHLRNNGWLLVSSDILFTIILGPNRTLEYSKSHSFYRLRDKDCQQDLQMYGVPYLIQSEDEIATGTVGMWANTFYLVYSKGNDYKFMTCSAIDESHVSFQFYFEPFTRFVWIILLAIIGIQPLVILLGLRAKQRYQVFPYLLQFFPYCLLEVVPQIPKILRHNKAFLILFCQWSLVCVLISNG
jgi:hypothetical protein